MPNAPVKRQAIRFSASWLELRRKHHAWSKESRGSLFKCINLRPDDNIVELGCGTGAFTSVLASGLDKSRNGRVIGIDRNKEFLRHARAMARLEGFSTKTVSFKQADVARKRLPLPNNFADKAVCQAFLWLFTDAVRERVLAEMIRVCKPKGIIAAVEGAIDTSINYIPYNDRLNALLKHRDAAEIEGYRKVYGYDRQIGYKLPTLFKKLGLERVRLDASPSVRLECDDRFPIEYKMEEHRLVLNYSTRLLSRVSKLHTTSAKKACIERAEPTLTT
jgi:ubiquinone/menaquinone biosynthesis C-methylase UbiE